MELFKNFQFGGLFQAGKRMTPPWGSFRRFTNAFKDATDTIQAYGRGADVANAPTVLSTSGATGFTHVGVLASQVFKKGILQFHAMVSGATNRGIFSYLSADNSLVTIMQPYKIATDKNCVVTTKHMTYLPSSNYISCVVARKAYLSSLINTSEFSTTKSVNGFTPEENWLMAFDGIRLRGAGLPLPWSHIDIGGGPGAHYARTVYVTIGLDGEAIFSPYMELQLSSNTPTLYLSGYSAYPGTKRSDYVGGAAIFPPKRSLTDHLYEETYDMASGTFGATGSNTRYFDKRYILHGATTVTTITAAGVLTMTNMQSIGPGVDVGDWIMSYYPVYDNHGVRGMFNGTMMMLQIASIVGSTVTYSKDIKYLDEDSVTWIEADMKVLSDAYLAMSPASHAIWLSFLRFYHFSNMYMIISYSTTQGSGYRVGAIQPVCWEAPGVTSTATSALATPTDFTAPWLGVVSSYMEDWYDTATVQTTFPPVKGVTNYKELLIGFDANAIYFSNIGVGGSTEMVSGLSNIVPTGSEFGDIVAVMGTESFLLISRERRNYILTGDIAGSSFNIDECDISTGGAYNARCVANAWSGQAMIMNSTGVYAINSSGAIKDISKDIKGLFLHTNRDRNLFDKAVFRTVAQNRTSGFDTAVFKIFLEDTRRFVIFLSNQVSSGFQLSAAGSNMLVFDTRDEKWYEFQGGDISSAESIGGKIYGFGFYRAKEDGVLRNSEKQLLVTQWLTVDVPSLEKQICQLKLYGTIESDGAGVTQLTVGQQNDWTNFNGSDRTDWKTNTIYLPDTYETYYHKKRLDSSKPLTTSIILESISQGTFALEGMEIEGVVVQGGIKK